jgi:hypothetical protein
MQRCAARSGDLKTVADALVESDSPKAADKQEWLTLQSNGVISGWIEQYVASSGSCFKDVTTVGNRVLQFSDPSKAATYWSKTYHCPDQPFHGQSLRCGAASGLGVNSVSYWWADPSGSSSTQCVYAWQQKQFITEFAGTGVVLDACQRAVGAIKARIT